MNECKKSNLNSKYVALNCARNCLRYVIKTYDIKEIHIPFYTCPVVWQSAKKEGCRVCFYHIDKDFMPVEEFGENDFVVYTNYFGVCANNVKSLSSAYKNLIVDNSQAFYMQKYGIASFNSIRKFFSVPDGACLFIDKYLNDDFEIDETSKELNCFTWYTQCIDKEYIENENRLNNSTIKRMSLFSESLFKKINCEQSKQKRLQNFKILADALNETNLLKINLTDDDVPMVYPYLNKTENLRTKLEQNNIYIEQYWSPMEKNSIESDFQKYILPLPVNQIYTANEMNELVKILL